MGYESDLQVRTKQFALRIIRTRFIEKAMNEPTPNAETRNRRFSSTKQYAAPFMKRNGGSSWKMLCWP